MGVISEIIGWPLGWVMWLCYKILSNYGFALIFFTLITKILLFPMTLKQQTFRKNMQTTKKNSMRK